MIQVPEPHRPPKRPKTFTPMAPAIVGQIKTFLILLLIHASLGLDPMSKVHLQVPPAHTALSGEVHIQVTIGAFGPQQTQLRLYRVDAGHDPRLLFAEQIIPDARSSTNTTVVKIPCGYFSRGGEYYVDVIDASLNETEASDNKVSKGLDVRWPMPRLSLTPEHVQTYPENPVTAILEFPEVVCPPVKEVAPLAIPEFWLELHYCGHSILTCDNHTASSVQLLYSEQIRGFPGKRMVTLRCELFGLAGHYTLILRPTSPMPSLSYTAAYVKAEWSDQFVFNVHARSIMPCDPLTGGITVLFQYPSCILTSGDRVRLYSRLRADVASLSPPTTMQYVTEHRVTRGQHSLKFDCDLFEERFVEYCFVYVSQAITGAVADVRMDCVPTLPVSDSESGGWGKWSAWTPCSTTCSGGTKSRYRLCDSPPPRYGAKFCEGSAVETQKCGNAIHSNDWECLYGGGISDVGELPADRPEVLAEVGPGCRCGCVVHLGQAKPRRLLATSSQSCPGRTFWLIQADEEHVVRFKVDHFRLPCGSQWLKVRDGNALSSRLLASLEGSREAPRGQTVQSTGHNLLLEFFSDELMAAGEACGGGFLGHAMQIKIPSNSTLVTASPVAVKGIGLVAAALPDVVYKLTAVHIAAFLLVVFVLIATLLLGAQYLIRYRKYHIAEDMDSLADLSESGNDDPSGIALRTRAASSSTLLSEVISLTRLRPPGRMTRHTRLRESVDCSDMDQTHIATETVSICSQSADATIHAEAESTFSSTATLTPPIETIHNISDEGNISTISKKSTPKSTRTPTPSPIHATTSTPSISNDGDEKLTPSPSESESHNEEVSFKDNIAHPAIARRHRVLSSTHLTKVGNSQPADLNKGCYSPAVSVISTATIRSTNPKESKEKRNLRLLQNHGSEFSLANTDIDMEMDYYDYNVVNAGAAPGSYLGMDPAYLVWIPPLDDLDDDGFHDHDIRPKQFIDPGSNQESPEEEILLPKIRRKNSISEITTVEKCLLEKSDSQELPKSELVEKRKKLSEISPEDLQKKICSPKEIVAEKETIAIIEHKKERTTKGPSKLDKNRSETIHKDSNKGQTPKVLNIPPLDDITIEKEIDVEKEKGKEKVKSPSFDNLDDIKFADDCDDEVDNIMCNNKNTTISYHENKNIITQNEQKS